MKFVITLALALVATSSTIPTLAAESGIASFYTRRENSGRTATGQRVDDHALRAAHKTLPFGSIVDVTNRRNGRRVTVCINDSGPFRRGRVIDLTDGARRAIGMGGLAPVTLVVLSRGGRCH